MKRFENEIRHANILTPCPVARELFRQSKELVLNENFSIDEPVCLIITKKDASEICNFMQRIYDPDKLEKI